MRVGFLIACLLLSRIALAAPAADSAEAQRHYTQGTKLYNLSMWKAALEAFQQAYLAKPDPALLFNIGQCQRQLGDSQGAANSYRAFLRESRNLSVAQRDQVQTILEQMEAAIRATRVNQPSTGSAPPAPPPTEPAPAAMTSTPTSTPAVVEPPPRDSVSAKKPLYKRWYLWAGVGAVVLVGVGLGVGLTASRLTYPSIANPAATVNF